MADQADRFDVMCVTFAKGSDLAKSQAEQITQLTQKLIDAVTKIRQDAQTAANACQEHLQVTIRELSTQGNARKKKILQDHELDTLRTVKANFMLVFGPPKYSEKYSKRTKYSKKSTAVRIQTVHGLCESHPDAVITLSTSYPTVVWAISRVEVFDGLIEMLKKDAEKEVGVNWPCEILDIMDTFGKERPMCREFKILRERKNSNFGPPTSPSTGRDQLATYHNTGYPSKRRKPEDPQSPFRDILQVAEPSGTALQNRERSQNIVSGRIVPEG
ncbi:hypothetical protein I7I51_03137 [Histoplasma capsulatum]|uniref:Uncharacterized protein n=1 Tax=Ajellomyces capsulatus TaxID=5037 RepID=A0A8A1MM69_AJECA|nr:hypothetical protein I7I51_03137 [Histoplasma capsulatum]